MFIELIVSKNIKGLGENEAESREAPFRHVQLSSFPCKGDRREEDLTGVVPALLPPPRRPALFLASFAVSDCPGRKRFMV